MQIHLWSRAKEKKDIKSGQLAQRFMFVLLRLFFCMALKLDWVIVQILMDLLAFVFTFPIQWTHEMIMK
jgi:hypothetical protein